MRIGYGWDSHEFKRGIALKIGGVTIPHNKGLAGHSDGDVLLHALTDALLGAIAAGDIGTYFPPSDPRWKDADSALFVRDAMRLVQKQGYSIANVDSTLILEAPKIAPHASTIQARIAELLEIDPAAVGVKAKTPEGMKTDHAAIAQVVVLLIRQAGKDKRRAAAMETVPQPVVDSVAEELLKTVPEPEKRSRKGQSRSQARVSRAAPLRLRSGPVGAGRGSTAHQNARSLDSRLSRRAPSSLARDDREMGIADRRAKAVPHPRFSNRAERHG